MKNKRWIAITPSLLLLCCHHLSALADKALAQQWQSQRIYFGPVIGYGSNDWGMMVMKCHANDPFCSQDTVGVSAPLSTENDSGLVWGFTAGYEFKASWAIEASYLHFPTTLIKLNPSWNYYMEQENQITEFNSSTWAMFAVGKFMTQIGNSGLRGFANAGIDFTTRDDKLTHTTRVNPTFGLGLNYVFPNNLMCELVFQYMAGYGDANEVPANDYIPFLYSLSLKLMYRL